MKLVFRGIVSIVLSLFLVACGGGGGGSGSSSNVTSGNFLSDESVAADSSLNFLVLANSSTATEQQNDAVAYITSYAQLDGNENINIELNAEESYQVANWKVVDFNVFNGLDNLESFTFLDYSKKSEYYSESEKPEKIDLGNLIFIPNLKSLNFTDTDLTLFKNLSELTNLENIKYQTNQLSSKIELLSESKAKSLYIKIDNSSGGVDASIGTNAYIETLQFANSTLKKLPNLSGLTKLNELIVYQIFLEDNDLSSIGEVESLETLELNNLTGSMYDVSTLPNLSGLKNLKITGEKSTSSENMLEGFEKFTILEYLDIYFVSLSDNLTDSEAQNIPISLKKLILKGSTSLPDLTKNTNIEYLEYKNALSNNTTINWNNIPTSVKTLLISSNEITSLNGIEVLVNLEYLYVDDNNLTSISPATSLPKIKYISGANNRDTATNTVQNFSFGTAPQ